MEQKNKTGILSYIARTKGVKFVDQPETWYNPANDEAKAMVKEEYKGKEVEIILSETPHKFLSMIVLDDDKKIITEAGGSALSAVEEIIDMSDDETEEVNIPLEEKVSPQTPLKEEFERVVDEVSSPFVDDYEFDFGPIQTWDKEYYSKLSKIAGETKTFGPHNLTYMSWAEAWEQLKKVHPDASYKIYTNNQGMPYFCDRTGGFVRVGVKVCGLVHEVFLPVMNHMNKSIPITAMTSFDINKNIQRAFVKAIAMHGLGLYVYKGEDYPEEGEK